MSWLARPWAFLVLVACSILVSAQAGPNTVAKYHHNLRTFSGNGTWFIVPIEKKKVERAVGKYPLGAVPRNNKSLFPNGFPAGKHPVMVSSIMLHDIRRGNLEIDWLYQGGVIVPFVDANGDGTPLSYAISLFIGGAFGDDLMGVVPALVGSLQNEPIKVAKFYPNSAAYQSLGHKQYSAQIKHVRIPNPISGPGLVPSAVDLQFSPTTKPLYTAKAFRRFIRQPLIVQGTATGNCQRNAYYFNESFANPIMQRGLVTLYPKAVPSAIAGTYDNVGGYSANGEMVSYKPKKCSTFGKS